MSVCVFFSCLGRLFSLYCFVFSKYTQFFFCCFSLLFFFFNQLTVLFQIRIWARGLFSAMASQLGRWFFFRRRGSRLFRIGDRLNHVPSSHQSLVFCQSIDKQTDRQTDRQTVQLRYCRVKRWVPCYEASLNCNCDCALFPHRLLQWCQANLNVNQTGAVGLWLY